MNKKMKRSCLIIDMAALVLMILAFVLDRIPAARLGGETGRVLVQNAWVPLILSVIAQICALIYLLKDANKQAAIFYKGFTCSFLLLYIHFFVMTLYSVPYAPKDRLALLYLFLVILLVGYSAILLLTFAQNQGKKRSLTLAAIAAVMELAMIFFFVAEGISAAMVCSFAAKMLMILLLYLMVEAKYQDKEARGTI